MSVDGFHFKALLPDLTETTPARYSEAADRPDIKAWPSQRAADVVRRGIASANTILGLRAGDEILWNAAPVPNEIGHRARGVILGFRARQVLVSFPPPPSQQARTSTEPWQGFVGPGSLLPAGQT